MAERESGTYREGDLIRATNERGDKIEGKLIQRDDGKLALGAYNWIFPQWVMDNAGFSEIELLEAAPELMPTAWGAYADCDGELWFLDSKGDWYDLTAGNVGAPRISAPDLYAPFTRLYTKEEVVKLARNAAWKIDDAYEYGGVLNEMVKELEATL